MGIRRGRLVSFGFDVMIVMHGVVLTEAELAVIDEGAKFGVKTLVIMSPTIYGIGSGVRPLSSTPPSFLHHPRSPLLTSPTQLFNTISIQVPAYARTALGHGQSIVIGSGSSIWDHVHIADLGELYTLAVVDILDYAGKNLPHGQKGIIFSANGRATWRQVAEGVAAACVAEGVIKSTEVQEMSLDEGSAVFYEFLENISPEHVEAGLSSNSRTVASVARRLGWRPRRGEEDWQRGFRDDVKVVLEKRRAEKRRAGSK